jgi:hypothetical protein
MNLYERSVDKKLFSGMNMEENSSRLTLIINNEFFIK